MNGGEIMKNTFFTEKQFEKTPIYYFVESYMENKNRNGEKLTIEMVRTDHDDSNLYHVEYKCQTTKRTVKIQVLYNPRNYSCSVTEIFDSLSNNNQF